jgi:hypothetical protein
MLEGNMRVPAASGHRTSRLGGLFFDRLGKRHERTAEGTVTPPPMTNRSDVHTPARGAVAIAAHSGCARRDAIEGSS